MKYLTDIEIAQNYKMQPIGEIAAKIGIDQEYIEQYGKYKAKIDNRWLRDCNKKDGKLILVTAITPTPAGEGKTTTTIGLSDAMNLIGKKTAVALREPSLGPVFGIKGGAAGGGYSQVVPMEDINLHFTGGFHAIGAANNLLAAMLDNHIYQGNAAGHRPEKNHLETLRGHERSSASFRRGRIGRKNQRNPARGRLRYHRRFRNYGGFLPCKRHKRS